MMMHLMNSWMTDSDATTINVWKKNDSAQLKYDNEFSSGFSRKKGKIDKNFYYTSRKKEKTKNLPSFLSIISEFRLFPIQLFSLY